MQENSIFKFCFVGFSFLVLVGCSTAGKYREKIDQRAAKIIEQKQMEALGQIEPFSVEPPEETLRKKLMLDQNLPYSSPASMGTKNLKPIPFWPKDDYLKSKAPIPGATVSYASALLRLNLLDTLQTAALNNRQYQTQKENVFRSALSLDLARYNFRTTFTGSVDGSMGTDLGRNPTQSDIESTGSGSVTRKFLNGISLTARIGFDLLKLINPFDKTTFVDSGDASITIPLLRGAGKHIVAEPLTQAERDTLYAIHDFERYKRSFAVSITDAYLATLQAIDQIDNASANYGRAIVSTRLIRRLADAGKQKQVDVDQTIQQEYNARSSWISAQFRYQSNLDNLKIQLGVPPDAQIELDRDELHRLTESARSVIRAASTQQLEEVVPPADAPVTLRPISREGAGPMELDEDQAIQVALENRLDLRSTLGRMVDAQRKVTVAADALRAELSFLGTAASGDDLNFEKGRYNALLTLNLPIERTREVISYRQSILSLESAVRNLQDLEDSIKLNVRTRLRDLQETREQLQIQAQAVNLNVRRVKNTELTLLAGRAIIRDVLDAQRDLLSSQNALTTAMVNYRLSELELQRDLDVLIIDKNGLWKEFSPKELNHERKTE